MEKTMIFEKDLLVALEWYGETELYRVERISYSRTTPYKVLVHLIHLENGQWRGGFYLQRISKPTPEQIAKRLGV